MSHRFQHPLPHLHEQERGRMFHRQLTVEQPTITVNTGEWEHVCSCRFGEGRPAGLGGNTKWTGDSYRYDIFRKVTPPSEVPIPVGEGREPAKMQRPGREQWALRWWNGGGEGWLLTNELRNRGEANLLAMIAEMTVEERRWDACHFIWEAIENAATAATDATAKRYKEAFVNGKLKKRKQRGRNLYSVTIEG